MEEKKRKIESTLEYTDCAGQVKKVLLHMRQTNKLAYKMYCHVLRPRRKTWQRVARKPNTYHFLLPGHPLNAFDDNWDGQLNMDYFEPFPYRSLPPKMITPMKNINKEDPVTSIIRKKNDWEKIYINMKCAAGLGDRTVASYEKLNDEVVRCQKHLVNLAAHLDSDPEPLFSSAYNWLYAGRGNLQLADVDGVEYLLHSQFTTTYLSKFDKSTLSINMEHVASYDCGEENNILETIYSPKHIIVLRTKHKVFILKLIKNDENIELEKLKCVKSEMLYTSVTFDNFHTNILYITTIDYKLSIVNLDRMKARSVQLKGKVPSLANNWNTVLSSERSFYMHVARHTISTYDKRSNDVAHVYKEVNAISDEDSCNDITVAEHFTGTHSLYFGTKHHLFLMDLRRAVKIIPKVVQRWTHAMVCPPTYMSHCKFDLSKELICLSSQWCEDMCVVPDYTYRIKDTDSGGVTMPYRPPSIFEALNEMKQSASFCDLLNPIEPRLVIAVTGTLMLERGNNYEILMQNGFGDISCHTLFPEHALSFVDDDSAQKLQEWCEAYTPERRPFEVSSICNIAPLWKLLKKMPDNYKILSYAKAPEMKFNPEQEIKNIFENEEVDVTLKEAWESAKVAVEPEEEENLARNAYFTDDNDIN